MTRDSRAGSSRPSSRSNSHARFCCASKQPLQPVGEPRHHALQMRQLLVEIATQPVEFLRVAEILGADDLVELCW